MTEKNLRNSNSEYFYIIFISFKFVSQIIYRLKIDNSQLGFEPKLLKLS